MIGMASNVNSASSWRPPGAAFGKDAGGQGSNPNFPMQANTLSSETLTSLYEASSTDTSKQGSDAGSGGQMFAHVVSNASEPTLNLSNASSYADMDSAGGYHRLASRQQHDEDVFSAIGGLELGPNSSSGELSDPFMGSSQTMSSRALFVRNINTAANDDELLKMFQTFGDVRQVYTACKHRGFATVTYHDLRCASAARAALHGSSRGSNGSQPLDVQYAVSKSSNNASQDGTVTIFNLDPDTSNEHLVWLLSKYGDVKEIKESPDRPTQKFITFYDTRHAADAMAAMAKAEHLDKVPPSYLPQVAASMSQAHLAIPPAQSLLELAARTHQSSGSLQGTPQGYGLRSTPLSSSPTPLPGSSPTNSNILEQMGLGYSRMGGMGTNGLCMSDASLSSLSSVSGTPSNLTQAQALLQAAAVQATSRGQQQASIGLAQVQQAAEAQALEQQLLHSLVQLGQQQQQTPDVAATANLLLSLQLGGGGASGSSAQTAMTSNAAAQLQALLMQQQQPMAQQQATAGTNMLGLALLQNQLASNLQELQARQQQQQQLALAMNLAQLQGAASVGGLSGLSGSDASSAALQLLQLAGLGGGLGSATPQHNCFGQSNAAAAALQSLAVQQIALQQAALSGMSSTAAMGHATRGSHASGLHGLGMMHGMHGSQYSSMGGSANGPQGRGGRLSRRTTDPVAEAERKQQQERLYALDMDKIRAGEDRRTTLMIKNIPNKYTQKMLLTTVDDHFRGMYDFFYLPIDFKNKCNVGYAFINMVSPMDIIPLVERFNHRKWERFNSEKVCHIAYARIQGRAALVSHFQNSSLMHEDKRCRPILFNSGGEQGEVLEESLPGSPGSSPPNHHLLGAVPFPSTPHSHHHSPVN